MLSIDTTALLVIDVQGKLASLVHRHEELYKNIQISIKAAQLLNIPILWTEQCPEKIGVTVAQIANALNGLNPIIKASFSCCLCDQFNEELKSIDRNQILVCGIETHVCVYQTVADLVQSGYEAHVITNAVSSRVHENTELALKRMQAQGAILTSTEMAAMELIRTSTHPKFKELLNLIK